MFTGLIEEVGSVLRIDTSDSGAQLQILAPLVAEGIRIGESIAVNGCCLTVTAYHDKHFTFDLLGETLDRTNLKALRPQSPVNLERALAGNTRLGGHFVQGHVDCAARILALVKNGAAYRLEVELPAALAHYVTEKGSIAVNGISLTVAELSAESFAAWIVSHTQSQTNLATAGVGDLVNLEFDLIAKYVESILHRRIVPS